MTQNASDNDPANALQCPSCGYSLHGLPSAHRCPECGFAYDEEMEFIRPKSYLPFVLLGLAGVILIGFLIIVVAGVRDWTLVLMMISVIVSFGFQTCRLLNWRPRAVLTHAGIKLLGYRGWPDLIEWQDVGRIDFSPLRTTILIRRPDGRKLLAIEPDFFGSTEDGWRFVRAANIWLARYRSGWRGEK